MQRPHRIAVGFGLGGSRQRVQRTLDSRIQRSGGGHARLDFSIEHVKTRVPRRRVEQPRGQRVKRRRGHVLAVDDAVGEFFERLAIKQPRTECREIDLDAEVGT